MPMLDAYIPEGALRPEAERQLLGELTDLLLRHEGADPTDERTRSIAWVFVHRPQVYVAGAPAQAPCYRFICQVPEGQYNDERRAAVTAEMTAALAKAEDGRWPDAQDRVWVFTLEIPDGNWGAMGRVVRLPDIAGFVAGDAGRQYAERTLAARRRESADALLGARGEEVPA
jgi:phenylpyruvate tautomerase PptA (4-oxalocrotonate tautomerase family)